MTFLVALLIGVVAGSRTMTAPAAVAWGAWLGWIDLSPTWAAFMGSGWALAVFSVLAVAEYVTDRLPSTPSRKVQGSAAGSSPAASAARFSGRPLAPPRSAWSPA